MGNGLPARRRGPSAVWSTRSLEPSRDLKVDSDIKSLEFAEDGSAVMVASADGRVRLWDWRSAAPRREITTGAALIKADLGPGSRRLAVLSDSGDTCIWPLADVAPQCPVKIQSRTKVTDLAWAVDNLMTIDDTGVLAIWSSANGELLNQMAPPAGFEGWRGMLGASGGTAKVHVPCCGRRGNPGLKARLTVERCCGISNSMSCALFPRSTMACGSMRPRSA